jgi:hypothetical protein
VEKLRKLEIIKLLKELEFIESDLNFKIETIREIDEKFNIEIEIFINEHPKLKHLLDEKKEYELKNKNEIVDNPNNSEIEEITTEVKNQKVKKLYRNLVKIIHPDKMGDENLKDIFIQAKKAYEENNLLPIISLCDKLNIPYDLDEGELKLLITQIDSHKKRLKFLESTYTWQWFLKPEKKEEIFLSFIKSQLTK